MNALQHGEMKLTWLESARALVDGGGMFGVVNYAVWSRKYPSDERHRIEEMLDPILIQYQGKNYLIDAGFETSKFNPKKMRNTGLMNETTLGASLKQLNLTPEDIDGVLMTHMHDDHASGLTRWNSATESYESVFPNASIYVSEIEWHEVRHPNARTRGTYLQENWEPIQDQVITFNKHIEPAPGIEMIHAGGHTKGLAVIKLTQGDETLIHLSDLMVTTASMNPLWVSAFDDYPMDSIQAKQKWLPEIYAKGYKLIFYHDAYYCMLQFDSEGRQVIDSMERKGDRLIPWPAELPKPYAGL